MIRDLPASRPGTVTLLPLSPPVPLKPGELVYQGDVFHSITGMTRQSNHQGTWYKYGFPEYLF